VRARFEISFDPPPEGQGSRAPANVGAEVHADELPGRRSAGECRQLARSAAPDVDDGVAAEVPGEVDRVRVDVGLTSDAIVGVVNEVLRSLS
jgi:hypothetical protein